MGHLKKVNAELPDSHENVIKWKQVETISQNKLKSNIKTKGREIDGLIIQWYICVLSPRSCAITKVFDGYTNTLCFT